MNETMQSYEADDPIYGYYMQTQLERELRRLRSHVNLEKVAPTLLGFCEIIPTLVEEHIYQCRVSRCEAQIEEFKREHPDFDELLPEIKRTVAKNHYLNYLPDGLERAYEMTKSKTGSWPLLERGIGNV